MDKVQVVILAAGKGKRMMSEDPKALSMLKGKPFLGHILETVQSLHLPLHPVVVVGYKKERIFEVIGEDKNYAHQEEQLGTGHAVMITKEHLHELAQNILVLYADQPLVSKETIQKLINKHLATNATLTMATLKLSDFSDWKKVFYTNFSRIVRDAEGRILKSVEVKDASEAEKEIKEINPCYFVFKAQWLWEKLRVLKNENAQKEYYLTDLVKMAVDEKENIESVDIKNPIEALGANSKEELEMLERLAL
jgi:bifunctional UDP-N-acetylglucosamine pyrophosphorylase/glucosamine-1-phosphate N-acetyltransferase